MLPHGLLTIPQIQRERQAGSKLMYLTTLLEYLLKLYNPNVTAADVGKDPKVGERVLACQHLFNEVSHVLWSLKVRNSFAHALEGVSYSERQQQNAVDHLIEAIGAVCAQPRIPRDLVQVIYHDPDAGRRAGQSDEERQRQQQQAERERERQAQVERTRRLEAEAQRREQARLERDRQRRELREKRSREVKMALRSGIRWVAFLVLLALGAMYVWPKLVTLYKGDQASASVVRTAAELTLKKIRDKRKQREYGAIITQADAAWRDGEIEYRRRNYKLAEEKYRQMIALWDNLNARIAETSSFEELLADVNAQRLAARNALAPQRAAELWNQAEETRRNAETARRNGNLQDAKNLIIQARQQYETAQATALSQTSAPETVADDNSNIVTPETSPTATQAPAQTPTAVVQPTVEKTPAPTPVTENDGDDDTFTIREREFMRYVTRRVNPVIPPQARSAGVSGPVVIEVWLSKHGHLSKASVLEGDPLLREPALAALRQWNFRPYQLDRVPTGVRSEITINVR
ncbi:MAG: TonB family protein [Blastocatellia bacterium]